MNAALSRLGAGWASWIDAVRLPSSSYPSPELSHFPDPISRLVDAERRTEFMREGVHYEGEYAVVVQFTPPLRRRSKVADLIYDDDPAQQISPASRILEQFKKALADLEDAIGDAVGRQQHRRRVDVFLTIDAHGAGGVELSDHVGIVDEVAEDRLEDQAPHEDADHRCELGAYEGAEGHAERRE